MLDRLRTALGDRYLVERELGQGGMALVYLARDLKHDNAVALKVLRPEVLTQIGANRFLDEIKVTAKLQHPHILTLLDSGEVDGLLFYVTPYVEGGSLRGQLARDVQLKIADAIRLTMQVAGALEYAHRRSLLHRDIKPENILIQEGQALLADFGISLALDRAGGTRFTQAGVTVGTPQYMSPEQAAGNRELDGRSDVYSLAAVMYETLAGEPPLTGPTMQAVLRKLVTDTPRPIRQLRDQVSPELEAVLAQALAKLPADRFSGAGEFAEALERVPLFPTVTPPPNSTSAATLEMVTPVPRPTRLRSILGWSLPVAGALVLAGLLWWRLGTPAPERSPIRFVVPTPSEQVDPEYTWAPTLAVGPAGGDLVFRVGGLLQLRKLDDFTPQPLAGTEGAIMPSFSPDGKWLAFEQNGHLRKLALAGGGIVDIAAADVGPGLTWGEDERIYFSSLGGNGGIWRVPATGGAIEKVTTVVDSARSGPDRKRLDEGENAHAWPQLLPGGKQLLFTVLGATGGALDSRIVIETIGTGVRKTVMTQRTFGRYLSSGQLLSVSNNGDVFATAFDVAKGVVSGKDQQVLANVHVASSGGAALLAVARDGTLAYEPGDPTAPQIVQVVDRAGREVAKPIVPDGYMDEMQLSPNGRQIAASVRAPSTTDIWLFGLEGQSERLTLDKAEDEYPVWSPTGKEIAYSSSRASQAVMLNSIDVAAGTKPQRILTWPRHLLLTCWSADGKWLLGHDFSSGQGQNIWAIDAYGEDSILVVGGPDREAAPDFSPDGRWVAYQSDHAGGRWEIFIVSFPDLLVKRQISINGGRAPRWDRQGGWLYYLEEDRLKAVANPPGGSGPRAGAGEVLFQTPARMFDVSPDGKRFLMLVPNPALVTPGIHVVTDWDRELKAKLRQSH